MSAEQIEAANRVNAFLDAATNVVAGDVLFAVPGAAVTLLLSDMRILAAGRVEVSQTHQTENGES